LPARSKEAIEGMSSALSYGASGGNRSEAVADSIGDGIRVIATESGFPENTSQVARSKFDRETAIYLASFPGLLTGEALRDDVWSYLATVILPDVVSWRFPDLAVPRFQGGVRNALQRLWIRGVTLDRGADHADRWGLVRSLSEDAAVQIFERASISGSRRLAIAIAESWAKMAEGRGRSNMEPVMRRATKLIRLKNEIVDLAGLSDDELASLVTSVFRLTWESFHTVSTDSTR
jgi:hypothetical protein